MRRHLLPAAICLGLIPYTLAVQPLIRVPGDTPDLDRAFRRVADGGVVEISPGVHPSPVDGFRIRDLRKSFTVRSEPGGRAVLDGGGSRFVLRLENSDPSRGGLVVFENLVFRDGFSDLDARAGSVTVLAGDARFVGCDFEGNATDPPPPAAAPSPPSPGTGRRTRSTGWTARPVCRPWTAWTRTALRSGSRRRRSSSASPATASIPWAAPWPWTWWTWCSTVPCTSPRRPRTTPAAAGCRSSGSRPRRSRTRRAPATGPGGQAAPCGPPPRA